MSWWLLAISVLGVASEYYVEKFREYLMLRLGQYSIWADLGMDFERVNQEADTQRKLN